MTSFSRDQAIGVKIVDEEVVQGLATNTSSERAGCGCGFHLGQH